MNDPKAEDISIAIPSIKQKFLVDLVNGIDVSRDRIKFQKTRGRLLDRLWDSLTGDSYRRQLEINNEIVKGLDNCFEWLNDLTEELTFTNTALLQVSDSLVHVKSDLSEVALFSADTRERLDRFEKTINSHLSELEAKIREVDLRERARWQMDSLFNSWEAGLFSDLSPAQRCFLVLTELSWGVFSDYCRIDSLAYSDKEQILKDLKNRLVICLAKDVEVSSDSRIDATVWLGNGCNNPSLQYDALSYLGNELDYVGHGFNRYVLNPSVERPTRVPHIMDAGRLVNGMIQERIRDGVLYVS